MLSNFSQYSPQGLSSQFPSFQGAGYPGYSPLATPHFGSQGPFGATYGHDSAQQGPSQQQPFGPQAPWTSQSPFTGFGSSPFQQGPLAGSSFGQHPAQQIVPLLGQIAQQVAVQSALTQQIGIALQQLAHLAMQSLQTQQGVGGSQPFGAFNPQSQPWGANRPATIQ